MSIGVLIPTFNEEKNIALCLKSLLRQTLRPIQIIVCDNESTDNTRAIASKILNVNNIPYQVVIQRRDPLNALKALGRSFCYH